MKIELGNLCNLEKCIPKKIISVPNLGMMMCFDNIYNKTQNCLAVIHDNGSIGTISTIKPVCSFAVKNGEIWYSDKNDIYNINSSGLEKK